jgi:hypothetical protein
VNVRVKQAVRAPQLAKRRRIHHRPSQKHEIFLGEEEISDVSLATFSVFALRGQSVALQNVIEAVGGRSHCREAAHACADHDGLLADQS